MLSIWVRSPADISNRLTQWWLIFHTNQQNPFYIEQQKVRTYYCFCKSYTFVFLSHIHLSWTINHVPLFWFLNLPHYHLLIWLGSLGQGSYLQEVFPMVRPMIEMKRGDNDTSCRERVNQIYHHCTHNVCIIINISWACFGLFQW